LPLFHRKKEKKRKEGGKRGKKERGEKKKRSVKVCFLSHFPHFISISRGEKIRERKGRKKRGGKKTPHFTIHLIFLRG